MNNDLNKCLEHGFCLVTQTVSVSFISINLDSVGEYILGGSDAGEIDLFELEMRDTFTFTISVSYIFRDLHVFYFIFYFIILFFILFKFKFGLSPRFDIADTLIVNRSKWTLTGGGNCFNLTGGVLKCENLIISEYSINDMKFIVFNSPSKLELMKISVLKANVSETSSPAINLNNGNTSVVTDSV
jgi:hypothetical protein